MALPLCPSFQPKGTTESSYFGLDRAHHRAVIVLADTGNPATTDLGINLLAKGR
jgi:hypothetical protein